MPTSDHNRFKSCTECRFKITKTTSSYWNRLWPISLLKLNDLSLNNVYGLWFSVVKRVWTGLGTQARDFKNKPRDE